MKLKPHFGVLVCALILGSCTFKYTPRPDRPMEPIIEFTSQLSLSIVNDQASTEEISVNGMIVNLKAWTKLAFQLMIALLMIQFGFKIDHVSNPFDRRSGRPP